MTVHRVYLTVGSNIDREHNYPAALALLAGLGRVAAVSPVYETTPVGMPDAAAFFNGAVLLETSEEPARLKERLMAEVEAPLGRQREPGAAWASRTVDVDIALWDDREGEILGRPVPDPDIARHLHVARPLADLAPDLVVPGDGRTLAEIAAALEAAGGDEPLPRHHLEPDP